MDRALEVKDRAALVPFLARPKPKISFLGLQTGTLATKATVNEAKLTGVCVRICATIQKV